MSTQNEIELLYHLEWIRKHFEEPSDGSLGITIVGMDGIEVSKWMKKVDECIGRIRMVEDFRRPE